MATETIAKKRKAPTADPEPAKKPKKAEAEKLKPQKLKSILKSTKPREKPSLQVPDSARHSSKPVSKKPLKRPLNADEAEQDGEPDRPAPLVKTKKVKPSAGSNVIAAPISKQLKKPKIAEEGAIATTDRGDPEQKRTSKDGARDMGSASKEKQAKSASAKDKRSKSSGTKKSSQALQLVKQATQKPALADDDDKEHEEDEDDQTAALLAGFESSGDEDVADNNGAPVSDENIPSIPSDENTRKKLDAAAHSDSNQPGVIYVGRIPHGFYEHQMRAYFSQFGDITRLRLSRNKRTGASKHYAFIEFASADVARIAAATMDKYLMFGHILQVRAIPPAQVHAQLFRGAERKFRVIPRNMIERQWLKNGMGREAWEKRIGAEEKRREEKRERLRGLGYEYEIPALKKVGDVPVRERRVPAAVEAAVEGQAIVSAVEPVGGDGETETLTGEAAAAPAVSEPAEEPVGGAEIDEVGEESDGAVAAGRAMKAKRKREVKKSGKREVKKGRLSEGTV